jgi:hypothetical protein
MIDYNVKSLLKEVFGKYSVIPEWDVANESKEAYQKKLLYCPRIDFAVKPLNIDRYFELNNQKIDEAYHSHWLLLDKLKNVGLLCSSWMGNNNPRCFLAIELENNTSTKHRLGSLINAGSIGKVGIIVTLNEKTYRSYNRILQYLDFIIEHKKGALPTNIIVVRLNEFVTILNTQLGITYS